MNFEEYKEKAFKEGPKLKEEYDALESEYELIRMIISREKQRLIHHQFSEKMGIGDFEELDLSADILDEDCQN